MRVIAGKAKRLNLKTAPGLDTRPTTDRIKETLFNMISNNLYDCRFLDLFSGSGGIGIEALSRGSAYCVFVEHNRSALSCIKENLAFTKLEAGARVMGTDVLTAINQLHKEEPFTFIFMDPPYGKGIERVVLEALAHTSLVNKDTAIIVEAALGSTFDYVERLGYNVYKRKEYKTNAHVFIKNKEA